MKPPPHPAASLQHFFLRAVLLLGMLLCPFVETTLAIEDESEAEAQPLREQFEALEFESSVLPRSLPYRLLLPKNMQRNKAYPLVLFLHGAGERGFDNGRNIKHSVYFFASEENRRKYPAIVVAPQCGDEHQWVNVPWNAPSHTMPEKPSVYLAAALELLAALREQYPVDPARIYITGLSMGGYGVWDAIQRHPELFAAAAPVCGGGDEALASRLVAIPIWAFHGARDGAVPVSRSRNMIKAIQKAGGKPRYTEYEDMDHNAWDRVYRDPEFYAWLFAQKRRVP